MLQKVRKHKLFKNTFALLLVQIVSYIAPLLVLPYLSRRLGVDNFGLVVAATSLIILFNIVTDFGFDLSATYIISRQERSKKYISIVLGIIYKLKTGILFLMLMVLGIYLSISQHYNNIAILGILISVCSQTYMSIWFYQGTQKMSLLVYIMLTSKIFYTLLVFLLVKQQSDYGYAILSHGLSIFVAMIISNAIIFKQGFYLPRKYPYRYAKYIFFHSFQFFLSRLATTTTSSISTLLVQSYTTSFQMGLYGASERLLTAFRSITAPLNQALYPYMANTKNIKLFIKICLALLAIIVIPFSVIFYYAEDVLSIIFGDEYRAGVDILRIFLVTGLIALFTMLLGYPAFAAINKVRYANISVIIGGGIQVVLLFLMWLTNNLSVLYIAWSILFIELIVFSLRLFWFIKHTRLTY